jgi:hypothetical protein
LIKGYRSVSGRVAEDEGSYDRFGLWIAPARLKSVCSEKARAGGWALTSHGIALPLLQLTTVDVQQQAYDRGDDQNGQGDLPGAIRSLALNLASAAVYA